MKSLLFSLGKLLILLICASFDTVCVYAYIQRLLCTNIVQLSGATGNNAYRINGYYEPIDEIVGNASVYKKLGDGADAWIEYHAATGQWMVRPTSERGTTSGWARATMYPARPLEDCPSRCWEVKVGSSWINQPSFSVSISSRALFEAAYAVEVLKSLYFSVICIHPVVNAF